MFVLAINFNKIYLPTTTNMRLDVSVNFTNAHLTLTANCWHFMLLTRDGHVHIHSCFVFRFAIICNSGSRRVQRHTQMQVYVCVYESQLKLVGHWKFNMDYHFFKTLCWTLYCIRFINIHHSHIYAHACVHACVYSTF